MKRNEFFSFIFLWAVVLVFWPTGVQAGQVLPQEPGFMVNVTPGKINVAIQTLPFTVVIFPDTQMWSQSYPTRLTDSANWVVANKTTNNIKFVIQVGDIVNVNEQPYQWDNANAGFSILDGEVPYCFAVGNHDMQSGLPPAPAWLPEPTRDTTNYNNTFPYTRYENEPWYGGRMLNDVFVPSDNYDNFYHFFTVGNLEFMIISLSIAPTDAILTWADGIVAANPNKRIIFVTHSYMSGSTRLSSDQYAPQASDANFGEQMWQKFVKTHENIFLVPCGHLAEGRRTDMNDFGKPVHQFVNNSDWLRILRFVPDENKIDVTSYRPWSDEYATGTANQYELSYEMN